MGETTYKGGKGVLKSERRAGKGSGLRTTALELGERLGRQRRAW